MIVAALSLLVAALSTTEAIEVILNSPNAVGPKRYAEAKEIVAHEAESGKTLPQFLVGIKTKDKDLAERYLSASRPVIEDMAAQKDNALAWYLLAVERNDRKCLQRAADRGNVQALNALGTLALEEALKNADTMPTNQLAKTVARSFDCFRRAAAKSDPNGFINLGTCYLRGFGCQRDMGLAFVCFKAAADAGHPEGMDNVSACLQFGHGVKRNDELSLYWRMRGRAARGDAAAMKWLEGRSK